MRLFDASDAPVWAIDAEGMLVYLSASTARWLGIDVETLLNRRCIAGSPCSDDPLDQLAASLSPPPGLYQRGTASLRVQPYLKSTPGSPASAESSPSFQPIQPLDVRFIRVGNSDREDGRGVALAIGGTFEDRSLSPKLNQELEDAAAIRQYLDTWRKQHTSIAELATIGKSAEARQIRSRLRVAASIRTHLALFGPPGCAGESIARRIHLQSSPREPLVLVDGALMDPELLDATIASAISGLTDSNETLATAIIRDLDEMPLDAQRHLVHLVKLFEGRFRIIGLCSHHVRTISESLIGDSQTNESSAGDSFVGDPHQPAFTIVEDLAEIICGLTVTLSPLSVRVEDIPLIATAILHARFAAKEGQLERIGRAAMDLLVKYPWPKNYDELDAAIRHSFRTASGDTLTPDNLPLSIRSYHPRSQSRVEKKKSVSLDQKLEVFERRLIETALEAAEGNRAEAARSLGITRSRLLRRIEASKAKKDANRSLKRGDGK
ncbi:Transcriptional regulatory protein ZraR [Novipirellula aureliae]|uniref:Transcriptional regulatory protein ZraR n=1 Tax=Novipirellula aureliae TaxID=2527966 RepID=A0A5C6EAA5_9BACT|nr:helix-turn-helix domain-containing protein [Novipirellula aureliae]TWU44089.1 Transcriptional regulatory protein ZraR [Novipirellula aureliae]